VNLLKEEFKARPSGYIRIKDFMALGALLLLLLAVSISNLFMELGSAKKENRELKQAISALSARAFQKPNMQLKDALAELENTRIAIRRVETSIDRKSSAVELLRELSSFLPSDAALEFTDIIIERERIKFAGKARTFADIDRIKEALAASEYFSEVTVSNTGTTGSTEGFAVSFLFDIKVRVPGGDASTTLTEGGG
jgi:Tfp pilus assembly protein PilN